MLPWESEGDNVASLGVHPVHPKGKHFLQWAFQLKSALATAETWHLKGCMPKVTEENLNKSDSISIPEIWVGWYRVKNCYKSYIRNNVKGIAFCMFGLCIYYMSIQHTHIWGKLISFFFLHKYEIILQNTCTVLRSFITYCNIKYWH